MDILRLTRTYRSAKRLRQIINVFLKYGFGHLIDQIHLGRYIPFRKRIKAFGVWPTLKGQTAAARLRIAFAELGPTFVKLAQLLSSRPDLVTVEVAHELRKLQDEVPPFPFEDARRIVEEELNAPLESVFMEFDTHPLAAASIAQVHRAMLFNGISVVVKIQRPFIADDIAVDISILSSIAKLLDRYVPESRFYNPIGVVEEFKKTVSKELNFINEARNGLRFKKNFEDNPDVCVPTIHMEYTTERVLVMEAVSGARIDDIVSIERMHIDRHELAEKILNIYFMQIFDHGFFHADPHPGNIWITPSGAIAFLDFGIVGRVTDELKDHIASTFLALIQKDFDGLIEQYIELGVLPESEDISTARSEFKADLIDLMEPIYGMALEEINFAEYLDAVTHLAIRYNLKIPSDLLLINKVLLVLDSVVRQLDPQMNVITAAKPYAMKILEERIQPSRFYKRISSHVHETWRFASLLPGYLHQLTKKALKNDIQLKMYHVNLPDFIRDMDKASNRISFALIVSSVILSSAIMQSAKVGPVIFGVSFFALLAFLSAFLLGAWLVISIIRSGRL